jgi:hypothetical protein
MSGGSSSRSDEVFKVDQVSCKDLVINTQLGSPKAAVVAKLKVGDELTVELEQAKGTTLVVAKFNGEIAGGLTSPELAQLRSCLEGGTRYVAKVQSITGGQVRVKVSAK